MTPPPVIGLTLDSEPPGKYSKTHPWYAIRENYCDAVAQAGGLPILLPHEPERVAAYLALIDGLVVTGGAFDVDPALFGAARSMSLTLSGGKLTGSVERQGKRMSTYYSVEFSKCS